MRYLVIEDHPRMRATLKAMLCSAADAWRECEDGSQAVAAFREFRPDWVLMDLAMRDVDGLEATRRLRAEFPAARVVIVTNLDGAEYRAEARAAGASGYVRKSDLSALSALLSGNSSTATASSNHP